MTTLLLSARNTSDNQALWRAAIRAGWRVERARGLHLPPELDDDEIVLCVEAMFAPTIATRLGLRLLEPADDWLVNLPDRYRNREVRLATLGEARTLNGPAFVKPPNDKSFEARVYASGGDLPAEFDDHIPVLIAGPVEFEVEYRCFVLDREIRTMSPYIRHGRLSEIDDFAAPPAEMNDARQFTDGLLNDASIDLPRAVVIDAGRLRDGRWAVVEANSAWGAGIYGCSPSAVLEVIRHAVEPFPSGQ